MRDKHIVITRPEHQVEKMAVLIRQYGGIPLPLPMIKVVPILPNPTFAALLTKLLDFDQIIFTSKNGVNCFFDFLTANKYPFSDLKRLKFAVVGSSTAKQLQNKGFSFDWMPDKFSGEDMGNELPMNEGNLILIPRAARGLPELPKLLARRGAVVTDLPVYDTIEAIHDCNDFGYVMDTKPDVFTFTSPSAVFSFKKQLEKCGIIPLKSYYAAIGPTTGKALSKCGFPVDILPQKYTLEDLIKAINKAF